MSESVPVEQQNAVSGALLHPAESMALTICRAQVERGDEPTPNTAAVCIAALARIDGRPIEGWPL